MSFRILIRWRGSDNMPVGVQGYGYRPGSFVLSVVFHAAGIVALAFLPSYIDTSPKRPIFDVEIRPEQAKIIWYDYRKPKPLPDVDPTQRIGTFPKPGGRELSKDIIIAVSPKPDSSKQYIWQPVPKIELPKDVPAPNLVARANTKFVAPPPEPKKEIRPNQPEALPAPQLNTSPQAPNGDVKRALEATESVPIPKPVKAFVPPPPSARQARLTIPVQTGDVGVPDASILGNPNVSNPLPAGIGAPTFSQGVAPPSNGQPGASNSNGNGKIDVAA